MTMWDALRFSSQGMDVARARTEIAAKNIANAYMPGASHESLNVQAGSFDTALNSATSGDGSGSMFPSPAGLDDASRAAVRVTGTSSHAIQPGGERQAALESTMDMLDAKSGYTLNVRAASTIRSMMLSTLDIGRNG